MSKLFLWFQQYGLLIVLLNCWGLLLPDLSPKTALTDLDLEATSASRSGSNTFKQLSWLLPLFLYILCVLRDGVVLRIPQYRLVLFFGFLSILTTCFLSILWSDFPALTFKRVVFQVVFISSIIFGVFYSIKHDTLVSCINILFYVALLVCAITIINGSGIQGKALFAWANSKNNFGAYILSLIALFCLVRYYYDDQLAWYWFKVGILFLLLIASASKTSIAIAILLLVSSFIPYLVSKILFSFIMISLPFVFLFVPLISSWLGNYWDVSYLMEPETLTGRGIIWDSLYYGVSDYGSFLSGHGYGAYFGTGVIPYALDDTWSYIRFLNSAHNGYLELLLQLGSILSLFVMFIIYKLVCYTENPICFLVASIILIHNITESSVIRDQHVIWSLLVLLICIGSFMREKEMVETVMESRS